MDDQDLSKSLGAIASILEGLKNRVDTNELQMMTSSRNTTPVVQTPSSLALPSFDPENTDSKAWLQKIEGYKNEFGWSDRETVSRVGPFLLKSAQMWFSAWQPTNETWEEFKNDFSVSFPKQKNLGMLLTDAVSYHSTDARSYVEYARVKLEKLKRTRANWSDSDMIEIIAHSIDDAVVRTAAFNCSATSVSDLIAFLANYVIVPSSYKSSTSNFNQYSSIPSTSKTEVKPIKCYSCGNVGHISKNCLNKRKIFTGKSDNICRYCKKPGHRIDECFRRQNKRLQSDKVEAEYRSSDKKRKHEQVLFNFDTSPITSLKTLPISILGYKTNCLIDTGSTCSLISESLVDNLQLEKVPCVTKLQWFDSTIRNSYFITNALIEFPDINLNLDLVVVPDCHCKYEVIIGENVYENNVVLIKGKNDQQIVPALSVENTVPSKPIELDVVTDLDLTNKSKLLTLLKKYSHMLTSSSKLTNIVKTGELVITLTENKTVYHHPYRMSDSERQKVRETVSDLLKNNIIRESNSSFASPIILTKKKDGSHRLCVDFRSLNRITLKDRYPLPRIDDQLDRLGKHRYFTSLDMASGFHQIPIHPESISKTAFVTPDGQYEYLRMPFGLANAPAVFQRAINKALGKLKYDTAIVYMDDIVIPSVTVEDGFSNLKLVLDALEEAGFSVNIHKCRFFMHSIIYLGREISADGIRPDPNKIKAVKESAPPTNVKQVRQFIGLASYFRKFIPAFSSKVACITNLTRLNVPFVWTDECEKARQYVIDVLTERPLLSIFDPDLETQLHTDASSIGLGAILLQKHGHSFRPVEYFSQKTSPDESVYHSFELETLAVVRALKHFRVYLLGLSFTLVTDCNSLRLSANKKDLKPRVARWWSYMQDFTFQIIYRKGSQISHVDFLSRNPIKLFAQIHSIPDNNYNNWLAVAQTQDKECKQIITSLNGNNDDFARKYKIQKETLFRIITDKTGKPKDLLPFVPSNNRYNLLKIFHDDQCHVGWEKTLASIKLYFWFPHMSRYVKKYVKHCLLCAIRKNRTGPKQGFLTSIPKPNEPFHTIHADCLGPLPGSTKNYKYILVIIDAFTKFCILYPQATVTAEETKQNFKNFVSVFGTPSKIISDAGTNFTAKTFKTFLEHFGIEMHVTTPGVHRSNGQIERYMRTITNLLRVEARKASDWPNKLWKVQLVLNTTKQKTTGCSPFKLAFGHEGQTPQIRTVLTDLPLTEVTKSPADYSTVITKVKRNADKQVVSANRRRRNNQVFKVGDAVLLSRGQRPEKFSCEFVGPYVIKSVLANGRYSLRKLGSKSNLKCSKDQLRHWPEYWTPEDFQNLLELNSRK